MRVHIVNYDEANAWILGKFARKLHGELLKLNVEASISAIPDPAAGVNHHIPYLSFSARGNALDTLMVTHVDNEWRFKTLRGHLREASMAICMSADMVRKLVDAGLPRERLCYVHPAQDGVMRPRPLNIGITSRIYDDQRKKEQDFLALCRAIDPADFTFTIMGAGWDAIVEDMRRLGLAVDYHPEFNYPAYVRLVPLFDYFLYLGHDEGSMGFLDALAAGVKTIVTRQGFHLDVPDGISHGFSGFEELSGIFKGIAAERRKRVASVVPWTWERYARQHLAIWDYLLQGRNGRPAYAAGFDGDDGLNSIGTFGGRRDVVRGLGFRVSTVRNSLANRIRGLRRRRSE
jgi:hypothetical protein